MRDEGGRMGELTRGDPELSPGSPLRGERRNVKCMISAGWTEAERFKLNQFLMEDLDWSQLLVPVISKK